MAFIQRAWSGRSLLASVHDALPLLRARDPLGHTIGRTAAVKAEAFPKTHLLQVAVEMELQHAVIGSALADAVRRVAHGVTADANTDVGK